MKIVKQNQFEQEHKAWQRSLEFFRHENALLKYRLSEMVDENEENNFLQMAEYFQNKLLLKDEMLNKLIKQLQDFSEKFNGLQNQKIFSKEGMEKNNKFREEILQFEKNFLHVSNEFNEKMLQNI